MSFRIFSAASVTVVFLLAAGAGCASPQTYSFNVSLKNSTPDAVTVWLTKRGGPEEADWLAPEAISDSTAAQLDTINGVVIPAGKTGDIGPIKGKFDPGSLAILRVYAGKLTYNQILATSEDGKLRIDVPLREGDNDLVVKTPFAVDRK